MATPLQKIQDMAGRIDRLGKYVAAHSENDRGIRITKARGEMSLSIGWPHASLLMCVPREGKVWERHLKADDSLDFDLDPMGPEEALSELSWFEDRVTAEAYAIAREEVIKRLTERELRRIAKPKTRGFKADMKKLKVKKSKKSPSRPDDSAP